MERKTSPTDLTDAQWALVQPLLPPPKQRGRHRRVALREVVNAILYLARSGGSWRLVPHDFPPWGTVWGYFRTWRQDGTWQRVHDALREQVRVAAGREATPSAAILDSQSVKTTKQGGRGAMTPPSR